MASKSLRFCNYPGCNELARGSYCEKHQVMMDEKRAAEKQRYDKTRKRTAERGYDQAWERCRKAYLSRNPLCEVCKKEGRITPAVLVHHVKPLSEHGARLDPANLMATCQPCHEAIHGPDRWRARWQRDGGDGQIPGALSL